MVAGFAILKQFSWELLLWIIFGIFLIATEAFMHALRIIWEKVRYERK